LEHEGIRGNTADEISPGERDQEDEEQPAAPGQAFCLR
jgi:hypothetical protein